MALINTRALVIFSNVIDFVPRFIKAIIQYAKQTSQPPDGLQRAGIKSVTIALSCAAIKGKISSAQVEILKLWAVQQKLYSLDSKVEQRRFTKAIKAAVRFFNRHGALDLQSLCIQISAVLPTVQRYDVLDLCIKVAAYPDQLSSEQVTLLKLYSQWLVLEPERFRTMVEKYLPIDTAQTDDVELLLGITSDLSREQVQQLLTEEFQKWNGRITNQDPEVRKRADKMLRLITNQRMAYSN